MSGRLGSVVIEGISPELDDGRSAVKRILGEPVRIEADIFKEGHDVLTAVVRWKQVSPPVAATDWVEVPMAPTNNDRWRAELVPPRLGRYLFTIEGWPDTYRTWVDELQRKVDAGLQVRSELLEGAALLRQAAERAKKAGAPVDAELLLQAEAQISKAPAQSAVPVATDPKLIETASRHADRSVARRFDRELPIQVERSRAQTGAWYEFFPRSASRDPSRHGTFKDCEALLPEIQMMGFDVIYLPPIHPIGKTARKGKNNSLIAQPDDVGSPWAIGGSEGGHKSVHPRLGTLEDFKSFVKKAAMHGLEVALDLAFQCSPDHPYVKEHPEWFLHRPDGTIKTAENPPKKYEDIVNFDWLGPHREALWAELKSVVMFWINAGVKIFRVDNPHTKPLVFWQWLIREVQDQFPEVVFLSEAFTRPKVMKALAKLGFTQSYTYFTWRNFKRELEEYAVELTSPPVSDYMRGNLWPNTPDILPEVLQQGGPPAFKLRLALAATLSSSYGIYSGYELCEGRVLPGKKEEYLDSEKYQLVRWDPDRPGNIRSFVAAVNAVRKENPALLEYTNLRIWKADNDQVLFYGKSTADRTSQVLVAVSLDPYRTQDAVLHVPLEHLGIKEDETYQVHELLQNQRALWKGPLAHVHLTPEHPAAIWRVLRFTRSEQSFDYYD